MAAALRCEFFQEPGGVHSFSRGLHLATGHAAAIRRRVASAGRPRDGSDYFWTDYQRARVAVDYAALHELELKCDGIGLLTMVAFGLDPAHLRVAARKITRFNERVGAVVNAGEYPDLGARDRFARDLGLLLGRVGGRVSVDVFTRCRAARLRKSAPVCS